MRSYKMEAQTLLATLRGLSQARSAAFAPDDTLDGI